MLFSELHCLDHRIPKQFSETEFKWSFKHIFAEFSESENIKQNPNFLLNKPEVIQSHVC